MKVLLSDGSGLTARQVATRLGRAGHTVEVLSPPGFALTRFTRWVAHVHPCPPFGADPIGWSETALRVLRDGGFDVLIPTQEQVAVLSAIAHEVHALGVCMAVPSFAALQQVQDKLSAHRTLGRLGLPQPAGRLPRSVEELSEVDLVPAYVKVPIGTASTGVHLARDREEMRALAVELAPVFTQAGGVVVQEPVPGPLFMAQAVFDRGRLVAWHANLRVREGSGGGAILKRSIDLPAIGKDLARLGNGLGWHGALSMDGIRHEGKPVYIDVNPRIVEPENAFLAGVDLVGALIDVAMGREVAPCGPGIPDVSSHQLLLAVAKAAESGRIPILQEFWQAATKTGNFRGSVEELLQARRDPKTLIPLIVVGAKLLIDPGQSRGMTRGTVGRYALSQNAWDIIKEHHGNGVANSP